MSSNVRVMLLAFALVGSSFSAKGDDDKKSRSTFQSKNMFLFGNPMALVPGAATLTRTDEGISFRVYTSGLAAGATTVWIVIFNKPRNCALGAARCMGPDLGNPAVQGSIVYGTGDIVGADGIANFGNNIVGNS